MRLISFIGSILISLALAGQEGSFESANGAYTTGNYKAAIQAYEKLVIEGSVSKEIHYNLGNAYYKDSQLGQAILHFEKALKLAPSDKNIKGNLDIARSEVALEVLEVPPFFVLRMWNAIYGLFSSTVWVIIQILLVLAVIYALYLWTLSRVNKTRLRGLKLLSILVPFLFLTYFLGRSAHHRELAKNDAIVLQNSALTSDPLDNADILEDLTPGVKVRILDKVDTWYKVSLVNKAQGWVHKDAVGVI